MKKVLCMMLLAVLTCCLAACTEQEREIQDSQNAMPVMEPNEKALPKGILIPEDSVYTEEELQQLSGAQITWGPGTNMDEEGRPTACISLQEQYGKYGASFIGPREDQIYLTFDEGYENGYTSSILDTLAEKEVSAVFFVTMDYVTREPELIQRMIQEGHAVGNHTTHHPNMTTLSLDEARKEIQELHDYVKTQFNYEMTLFRAPEGAISEKSMALLKSMGYQNVLWSFAYADWDSNQQMNPDAAINKVCERCHPGAIYLLHAVSKTNAQILGDFIDRVQSQGYTFGKLEEEFT